MEGGILLQQVRIVSHGFGCLIDGLLLAAILGQDDMLAESHEEMLGVDVI